MKTWQVPPVNKPIRKEPKGYIAYKNNQPVAENASMPLLRHIVKNTIGADGVTYKTIR